jgi:hypothetical protein
MVNLVDETYVVGTHVAGKGESPTVTCAPGANRLPLSVRITWPGEAKAGLTEAMVGNGFPRINAAVAETLGSALLVAVTKTTFGSGIAAGGVYRPEFETEPGEPVEVGRANVTVQAMLVFEVPLTLAESCRNVPKLTSAREGVTAT